MKNKKIYSIKKRLTSSVIALSAFFLMISLYFGYQEAHHEIYEVYDARLGQTAKIFLLTLPTDMQDSLLTVSQQRMGAWLNDINRLAHRESEATRYGHPYERNLLIQLYANNHLLWSSQPDITAVAVRSDYSGFGYVAIQNERWRFFQLPLNQSSLAQADNEYVFIAEKESIRDEMMKELALSSVIPQLVLVICIGFIMFFLVERHFRPIKELRAAITQRNVNKLDMISVERPTEELSPLVDALNSLLAKLDEAWKRERRFTRTAAHELKTPLAVLRINAENALRSRNQEELKQDLTNILLGIERSDRLIQQLLTFARVESVHSMALVKLNLKKLLQEIISDLVPLALKRHQEFSLNGQDVYVNGDESLLRILFSNIFDNAMRYSGDGSRISAQIISTDNEICVFIDDTGDDLTTEAREKLFEAFYRSNPAKGDGAGLGLAITWDIVQLHHGHVELLPRAENKNTFLVRLPRL